MAGRAIPCGAALLLVLVSASPAVSQVRLPQVKVAGKTPCRTHPESALETAELWVAAKATLEATVEPT